MRNTPYLERMSRALFLVDTAGAEFAYACIECQVDPNDLLKLLVRKKFYEDEAILPKTQSLQEVTAN